MIIDTHTHIFREETYKTYFAKADGKVSKTLTLYYPISSKSENEISRVRLEELVAFAQSKDNLFVIGSVNMEEDISAQLQLLEKLFEEQKIFGVKLYPGYQHFYPSDEKVHFIAELCQKYNKPLLFHAGDVYDPDGIAELKYSHPIHVDGLAVKFPQCKIVIAHFGFPYHLETANMVSKNTNVYTEISGTILQPDFPKEIENLMNQYAKDLERAFVYFPDVRTKTMFGTDYGGEHTPLNQIEPYIELVKRVFLEDGQEQVYYKLAENIFFN